ncbi:hypothetical protein [Streptomyces xiamenensis]|uniref:hypothetical protein n=1 Tax=Streptomyces xiamenensis TaxID=408015 RepID=UPI0035D7465F
MSITATALYKAITAVVPHAGNARYPYLSIEQTSDALHLIATDTYTLAVARIPGAPARPAPWHLAIDRTDTNSLLTWLKGRELVDLDETDGLLNIHSSRGSTLSLQAGPASEPHCRWRSVLTLALQAHGDISSPRETLFLRSSLLARWDSADPKLEWIPGPNGAPLIARGKNFIGLQMPMPASGGNPTQAVTEVAREWDIETQPSALS